MTVHQASSADLAGNKSQYHYSWTTDYTAPSISINLLSPIQVPSRDTSASIELVATEDIYAECYLDGTLLSQCESPLQVTGLSDGAHEFSIVAFDSAGNQGERKSIMWMVDTTAPILTISSVHPDEKATQETSIELSFTINESSLAYCQLDGAGFQPCQSPFTASGLADGSHTIDVYARDTAGNASERQSYVWEVTTRSVATLRSITPSASLTRERSIRFEFEGNGADSFVCSLDGAAYSPCSSPALYDNILDGDHTFDVRAVNRQGQVQEGASHGWTIDGTGPVTTLISQSPAQSPTTEIFLRVDFLANETATFQCTLDGISTSCSSPFETTSLAEGTHNLTIVATDNLGNTGKPVSIQWTIDRTAPVVALGIPDPAFSPTASTSLSLPFSVNESASTYCTLDNKPYVACNSPYNVSDLGSGTHTISVYAVDTAGNQGQAQTYSWVVDTTPVVFSEITVSQIGRDRATISWKTNLPATSQVLYGSGSTVNQQTTETSPLVTTHSVILTGLKSFTVYTYQVKSRDKDGREFVSSSATFRTTR